MSALPLWAVGDACAARAALGGPGADVEPLGGSVADFRRHLATSSPLVVERPDGILAVTRGGRRRSVVVAPTGRHLRVRSSSIDRWVRAHATRAIVADADDVVAAVGGDDGGLRDALLRARVATLDLADAAAVHPGPGASTLRSLRHLRLGSRVVAFAGAQLLSYLAFVVAWATLGDAALDGVVDGSAVARWGALLSASAVLRLTATHLEGVIGIGAGRALRRRALMGALRLGPDAMRADGVGHLTGSVLEAEVAEDVAMGGGLLAVVAVAELVVAGVILTSGAAPLGLPVVLAGWVGVALLVTRWYTRARQRWTSLRLTMTDRLVEQIIGHRTRLTQCPPSQWHEGEASMMVDYESAARRMDRAQSVLLAVVPRGWVLSAAVVLLLTDGTSTSFAVAIGGVLLALDALERISLAGSQIADALVAGARVAPFVRVAGLPVHAPAPDTTFSPEVNAPALEGRGLRFSHRGAATPVITGCDIVIDGGARVVLEAPSGAGKSTLAAMLAGIRQPDGGTLRLRGEPRETVADTTWRRRVSLSPQLHENHLLLGSLGFNLLIGRGWPASPADLDEAWELCQAIGLGPLLENMPSGLAEMVGDAGWQLSLGERSLVFAARSLLQRADVVLLDESFGSLDPVTMQRALATVVARAPALVVIRQ